MLLRWMLHSKHIILFIINIKNIQPDISLLAPWSLSKKADLDVSPLGLGSSSLGSAPALRAEQALLQPCPGQFLGSADVAEMFSDGPA